MPKSVESASSGDTTAAPGGAEGPAQLGPRLEGIVASAMDGIVSVDDAQRIVLFNPAAEAMFGIAAADALGQDLCILLPERRRSAHAHHVEAFLRSGATNREMRSSDGRGPPRTVSGLRANGEEFPVEASISQMEVGGARFATVFLRDISGRIADEEARELLVREVDHRAKNALSVVLALVKLTRAASKEEFVEAVRSRVTALARSHSLLAKNRWGGADLRQILEDETAAYLQPGQVVIRGQPVTLRADVVEPIALVIHELATNAVKYGALSDARGRVNIDFAILPGRELELRWRETGGPAVAAPASRGFGFTLIDRLVTQQLGGKLEVGWPLEGLQIVATFPAAIQRPDDDSEAAPPATEPPARLVGNAPRVLIVEDEPLVAMELGDQLAELDWQVVGPATTIEEASRLLEEGPLPDVAVLDLNLRGRLVYPIADRLRAAGVPIVFCTGYEQVELKYRDCPVVRKPVKIDLLDAELSRLARSKRSPRADHLSPSAG